MKKVVKNGLLVGLVMLIVSLLVGQVVDLIFPSLKLEYENPALFRPWSDPLMQLYFLEPFVLGLILSWIWSKTMSCCKVDKCCSKRGICFGLTYFLITIPGMIMSYSSFPISLALTLSWTVSIFFQSLAAGWMLEKLEK